MHDYPLLSFQQSANVDSIDFFGNTSSLSIVGRGFENTTAVLINGYRSPTFVVLSPTRILADQPPIVLGNPITSITVLKSDIRDSSASVISFEANLPPIRYSEQTLLVQQYLKILLTTPGSDIFSPRSGGGLLKLIGAVSRGVTVNNIGSYAQLYAQRAATQMIEAQANSTAPMASKLKSVTVLSSQFNVEDTSLDLRISIEAMDGTRASAGLVL